MGGFKTLVSDDKRQYVVDSRYNVRDGFETVVFACKHFVDTIYDLKKSDIEWDFGKVYREKFQNFEDLRRGHLKICMAIEDCDSHFFSKNMKKPRTQSPTRHSRAGLVRPAERRIKKPKGFSFLNAL